MIMEDTFERIKNCERNNNSTGIHRIEITKSPFAPILWWCKSAKLYTSSTLDIIIKENARIAVNETGAAIMCCWK